MALQCYKLLSYISILVHLHVVYNMIGNKESSVGLWNAGRSAHAADKVYC